MGVLKHLTVVPGGRGHIGPLHKRKMRISCKDCGNTQRFVGKAGVEPTLQIEPGPQPDGWEVTHVGYQASDDVDETIERCGVCGSRNIQVVDLKPPAPKPYVKIN